MKTTTLLASLALLAGCSSTDYKPDLAGRPSATIRLTSLHPAPARVAVLSGECVPFEKAKWEKATRSIALVGKEAAQQRVPAGEPINLAYYTSTTTVSGNTATDAVCAIAQRFTPVEGAEYEAMFAGDQDNCWLEIRRVPPLAVTRVEPVDAKLLPSCD